jgi:hypothetical protein
LVEPYRNTAHNTIDGLPCDMALAAALPNTMKASGSPTVVIGCDQPTAATREQIEILCGPINFASRFAVFVSRQGILAHPASCSYIGCRISVCRSMTPRRDAKVFARGFRAATTTNPSLCKD